MLLSERLELLLDSTFIYFSADCFQWAIDSEVELNSLDEKHRKEVLSYHRGDDYKAKAIRLVNQEYQATLREHKLGPIEHSDLERGWLIVNRVLPKDPLGIIYSWFTSHAALYIPDRFNSVLRPIEAKTKDEVLDRLFRDFMGWAERNDHLNRLSIKAGDAAFIDEIEGMFKLTIRVLTANNAYLNQIFHNVEHQPHKAQELTEIFPDGEVSSLKSVDGMH